MSSMGRSGPLPDRADPGGRGTGAMLGEHGDRPAAQREGVAARSHAAEDAHENERAPLVGGDAEGVDPRHSFHADYIDPWRPVNIMGER